MATHAHTTTRIVRRRHAPPVVALPQDRRLPAILAQPITWRDRARIERDLDLLVALLDALDGDPDLDGDEDRCEAGDDDLTSAPYFRGAMDATGDGDDAEEDDDREPSLGWTETGLHGQPGQIGGIYDYEQDADDEPGEANDPCDGKLTTVMGGVPA